MGIEPSQGPLGFASNMFYWPVNLYTLIPDLFAQTMFFFAYLCDVTFVLLAFLWFQD